MGHPQQPKKSRPKAMIMLAVPGMGIGRWMGRGKQAFYPSIYLAIYPINISPSIYLSIYLSIYISIYLSSYLSACSNSLTSNNQTIKRPNEQAPSLPNYLLLDRSARRR